ncbi:MAG: monovalent cation/H+ antiporter subunit D family protein [Candidatus Omnitrophica bacterium]|nr:monovalent cation/H+ antiporter subunit D family protein [Candidatus Omnitrophota bacterium]
MNEIQSIKPLLAILVSSVACILILFSNKSKNLRETWTFLAAILKFGIVLSLYPAITSGKIIVFRFFDVLPGVTTSLRIDPLGFYFALLSSFLWIITSVYSVGYMRTLEEKHQTRYFASFALSLSATMGIAFSGDLLTFFIFYEMLTIATYPLVVHKETPEAIQAGRKYLVYSLSAGAVLLGAIAWSYYETRTLTFTPGGFLGSIESTKTIMILFVLFIYGCAVKGALFPLHAWLPSAMVAPTPVSALLHAVAVVKAGVFGVLRVIGYVAGPAALERAGHYHWLTCVASFTILGASVMALAQDNLKRRLAYSTISQLAYIILGASLLNVNAYLGSMLHMANHAFMKITLFFCAGAIYAKAHKEKIQDMKGLGYQMPLTFIAFTLATLSLSGFPPFSGFISKWYLCKGALEGGHWGVLAVYLSSALLNAAYLLPVVFVAFTKTGESSVTRDEKPYALTAPLYITAVFVILMGCLPWLISRQVNLAGMASVSIFGG